MERKKSRKIETFLGNCNFGCFVLLFFALYLGFYFIWTCLDYAFLGKYDILFSPTPNETLMTQGFYEQLLLAVVLAPLIETLISQKWVCQLLSLIGWFRRRKSMIILLGAVLFGLVHFYSLSYIIYNFFIGALLMSAYIVRIGRRPYWSTVVLHGLMNLFALLIDPVEKSIFGVCQ